MAIDNERKRRSVINFGNGLVAVLPLPDGNILQGDRELMCRDYWGILSGEVTGRGAYNARQWGRMNQSQRRFVMRSASSTNRSGD